MTEILGFKFVRPDLTTPRGGMAHRYMPGTTVRSDDDVDADNTSGCPTRAGDGLCVAHSIAAAQSGGLPAQVMVLVAYLPEDVLGTESSGTKVRVQSLRVLDPIVDVHLWIRRHGAGADLTGADLTGANMSGADLYGANLYGANMSGAYLSGVDLTRATGDQWTRLPAGWVVRDGYVTKEDK